ncbi:MAG: hypothetical protein PHC51_06095 [bacterium]|nr:hypothetical protein [bacterium]
MKLKSAVLYILVGVALTIAVQVYTGIIHFQATVVEVSLGYEAVNAGREGIFDSISYAAQVGRLDVISLIFTVVAVLMAGAVVFGYSSFRSQAISAAKNDAADAATEAIKKALDGNLSHEIRKIAEEVMQKRMVAYVTKAQNFNDGFGVDSTDELISALDPQEGE